MCVMNQSFHQYIELNRSDRLSCRLSTMIMMYVFQQFVKLIESLEFL